MSDWDWDCAEQGHVEVHESHRCQMCGKELEDTDPSE